MSVTGNIWAFAGPMEIAKEEAKSREFAVETDWQRRQAQNKRLFRSLVGSYSKRYRQPHEFYKQLDEAHVRLFGDAIDEFDYPEYNFKYARWQRDRRYTPEMVKSGLMKAHTEHKRLRAIYRRDVVRRWARDVKPEFDRVRLRNERLYEARKKRRHERLMQARNERYLRELDQTG